MKIEYILDSKSKVSGGKWVPLGSLTTKAEALKSLKIYTEEISFFNISFRLRRVVSKSKIIKVVNSPKLL